MTDFDEGFFEVLCETTIRKAYEGFYAVLCETTVRKAWSAAVQIPQVKAIIDELDLSESAYVDIVYFDDPEDGPIVVSVVNV